jgi:hypothetical protein
VTKANLQVERLKIERTLIASGVPIHDHDSLIEYIVIGQPLGDFLEAVVENNLTEAIGRADETNRGKLFQICEWLYNNMPMSAWGSPAKYEAWIVEGGLEGNA